MKKIVAVCFVVFAGICLLSALDFEFKLLPQDSVYESHEADIWAPTINFHYLSMIEPGPSEIGVVTERTPGKEYINDNPDESMREHTVYDRLVFKDDPERLMAYFRFVLADQLQFIRFGVPKYFLAEGIAGGGINMVFEGCGSTDIIGFDGFYFIGGAIRLFDRVSVKVVEHHYSGHYGDEVLECVHPDENGYNYKDRMDFDDGVPGKIYLLEHYVRQNSIVAGITADVTPWLKVYFEADLVPPVMHVIRPWVLAPNNGKYNSPKFEGETVEQHVGADEGNYADESDPANARKNVYPDSYRDTILQFGAEARLKAGKVGNAFVAFDMMLYESGKTGYQIGAYSEEFGWAKDFNVALGFDFAGGLKIEATYHNGRFPLTHFFFHDCSYFSIGIADKL